MNQNYSMALYNSSILYDKGNQLNREYSMRQLNRQQTFIVPIDDLVNKFWMNLTINSSGLSRLPTVANAENVIHAIHVNCMFIIPSLVPDFKLYNDFIEDAFDIELYILNNRLNNMNLYEIGILKSAYKEFALEFYLRVIEFKLPLWTGHFTYLDANSHIVSFCLYPDN